VPAGKHDFADPVPSPCPRRGLGRGSAQGRFDRFYDTIDVREHLTVPEANNAKPTLFDQLGAPLIPGRLIEVLSSVELDRKFRLGACDVCDEISDWELAPKLELDQSLRSQPTPKFLFGVCLITPKSPSAMAGKGDGSYNSRHCGNSGLVARSGVAPRPAPPSAGADLSSDKERLRIRTRSCRGEPLTRPWVFSAPAALSRSSGA